MEKLREFSWLFKSSLFVVAYAVIALVVYDIVAEIHIQTTRTLFTSIDHAIPFISAFVVPICLYLLSVHNLHARIFCIRKTAEN
nr:hypothetical protein [Candidatus Baldrarchaeota archaeon]